MDLLSWLWVLITTSSSVVLLLPPLLPLLQTLLDAGVAASHTRKASAHLTVCLPACLPAVISNGNGSLLAASCSIAQTAHRKRERAPQPAMYPYSFECHTCSAQ
ncbi:hypothetical protein IE81DRAFT_322653 [Ceraceosorus guamensis]|uniref:Uncharacterized protein n=1 Tax=Ceraceosorus guamensis TaxID=1522189 RepID=A0A316W0D0_9BASI|nr:hypothetical protein IE81DRAFT_322653 [Ceraceosorus guamensis]PWN43139.1 hypothetical protein IE81DRAFT_322653 [Ceraceosorus guamensis]